MGNKAASESTLDYTMIESRTFGAGPLRGTNDPGPQPRKTLKKGHTL